MAGAELVNSIMRVLLLLTGMVWGGHASVCWAASPVLTHVHPAAVARGEVTEVRLVGTFDPWPCRVWVDGPGVEFVAGEAAGVFTVRTAADALVGPRLMRAFNAEGASIPISLVVADAPQILEVEPNTDFRHPQVLPSSTVTINGRHEKSDDVDSFAVELVAGQSLVAWVEAYVLAAGFDSMLRVVDAAGVTMAFNHDAKTLDPFLVFTAPRDGRYVIQTMGHAYPASTDVRFAGGETCIYRLHVSTGPVVRNTWPLGVTAGAAATVDLEGWNLTTSRLDVSAGLPPGVPAIVSDVPEYVETPEAGVMTLPFGVSGRIEIPGGHDRYEFTAVKDSVLEMSVTARRHGSEMDPWLKIRDADGRELAANDDDGGSLEPRLVWTVPADGRYAVEVGDLTQRAGADFFYRLQVMSVRPVMTAVAASHAVTVVPGKSADFKVVVSRRPGFTAALKVVALGLPVGVTAAEVDVPEAGGEVTLVLAAGNDAAAASMPIRLVVREVDGGRELGVSYSMATVSENNGVPQGYQQLLIGSTDQLWLTVTPPPPPAPVEAPTPAEAVPAP
jgi:hypothetical protein